MRSSPDGRSPTAPWWRGAVVYQIYPRSFADSNGDGVGDLRGIIERLDHLRGADDSLGVDAIWLSPTYPSPQADFGYDVADYTGVDPTYGTLADVDALIEAAHRRGLRVLLDLVPCHTSSEHPWFRSARSSTGSPHRNWYVWADPGPDGGPPNNWVSVFGGPAWTLDPETGQYYAHSFFPEQPQLNWREPAMAAAIHDAMRFWFDRGVDGFRVDAIQVAIKDDQLRDNPPAPPRETSFVPLHTAYARQEHLWDQDRPEVHEVVRGMRRVADEYGALLVGEMYGPVERIASYLGRDAAREFDLAFNFELLVGPWDADAITLAIERAEALHPEGSSPTYALSNHDQSRHATRYGLETARLAAVLLLTLRGTTFLYAGEEIGMVDGPAAEPPRDRAGRDAARTPMQWDASARGGFTEGEPWLPLVNPAVINVAAQRGDPRSLLSLYRDLISARRASRALAGDQRSILGAGDGLVAYLRHAGGERVVVVLNIRRTEATANLGRLADRGRVMIGTDPERAGEDVRLDGLRLGALEGIVVRLSD